MIRICPMAAPFIESFRQAVDRVARERRYIALLEAPAPDVTRDFLVKVLEEGHAQFVALDGETVVGWCDIIGNPRPVFRHCGTLGISVVAEHRGKGLGTALLRATLDAARAKGLTRIELTVRTDNPRARALYERFGFVHEGLLKNHMLVDGEYKDSHQMALLW